MNQNILAVPFWKVALRFSVSFLILLALVLTGATYFKNGNFNAISESFQDGSWIKFGIIRIGLAIIYGISMTYFSRKKAKKQLRN